VLFPERAAPIDNPRAGDAGIDAAEPLEGDGDGVLQVAALSDVATQRHHRVRVASERLEVFHRGQG